MKIVRVRPATRWPTFLAKTYDDDLGWTAECADLGITARGATWAELLTNCSKAIDALLGGEGEEGLTQLGYVVEGYLVRPGEGLRYDVPFDIIGPSLR